MEIRTYDEVDPLAVLRLNLLGLGYAFTPELAANIRRLDRRSQDYLCLYAVADGVVAGQVGMFVNTLETLAGPMLFGAAWAVCTLPEMGRRGIARALMAAAEERAAAAGCRAVTLGTTRSRVAHRLYAETGYMDVLSLAQAFDFRAPGPAPPDGITARRADPDDLPALEATYLANTRGMLGFVHRQDDFLRAAVGSESRIEEVHGVWRRGEPVGYILAGPGGGMLTVRAALLPPDLPLPGALAALRAVYGLTRVHVTGLVQPAQKDQLAAAGYSVHDTWGTFMLKPLDPALDFPRLLGVAEGRFFMDQLDFT